MARYLGSKTKLSKRVGRNLYLKGARSFSAKDDFSKRPYRAGVHGKTSQVTRTSEYGKQLLEKQAIRFTYGLMEKQLANLFKKAFKKTGNTGKIVLSSLERRLDNVVYRAGLANSRSQARQLVAHGHFMVNGITVNIPSYEVKSGDVIQVKENKLKKAFWKNFQLQIPNEIVPWMSVDQTKKVIKILNEPLDEDLPQEFNLQAVVEYYSRKVR
jgi:small subunit ribosomal protein S4